MQLRWEDARYKDKQVVSAISGAVRQPFALEELISQLAARQLCLQAAWPCAGRCMKVVGQRMAASVQEHAR